MDGSDALARLQSWYARQCDAEWEHGCGISICTVDNPGWSVRIAVVGTSAEGVPIPTYRSADYDENDADWVECRLSDDGTEYWGVGDQHKLTLIIDYFLRHAE
jgi:hypothetical protein